jgi:hypothetical protein
VARVFHDPALPLRPDIIGSMDFWIAAPGSFLELNAELYHLVIFNDRDRSAEKKLYATAAALI